MKGHPLLAGESRGPGVHLDSVVELLGRVARMMMDLPELHEVELNPVICTDRPGSCVAVDAVVRMERI